MQVPQLPFNLPDWAKCFAWVDLSPSLKVHVLALKYPRWEGAFYPIFLDQNNKPLFEFPKDLSLATNDGRIWHSCPERVYFCERTTQIVVDHIWAGDHPCPAGTERLIFSPPNFTSETIESRRASYGPDNRDILGDIPPKLSTLSEEFKERVVFIFENDDNRSKVKIEPSWPIEKPKPRVKKK